MMDLETKIRGIMAYFGLSEKDLERALSPLPPTIENGIPDLKED